MEPLIGRGIRIGSIGGAMDESGVGSPPGGGIIILPPLKPISWAFARKACADINTADTTSAASAVIHTRARVALNQR